MTDEITSDFSGLTSSGPKPKKPVQQAKGEIDFSGLTTKEPPPNTLSHLNLQPEAPLNPLDIEIVQRDMRDRYLHAVESQRQMVDINSDMERRGINPLSFKSDQIESLKKTVDPLYEKTGIFIPLPVSFNIDAKTGKTTGLVQDQVLLENNYIQSAQRTFVFAAEGIKGFPEAVMHGIASPIVAAKYHMALPLLEKLGAFNADKSKLWKVLDKANLPEFGMPLYGISGAQEDYQHYKDLPVEEKNRMLDEAAFNLALVAVDLVTQGLAAPLISSKFAGRGVGETMGNVERIPMAERASYLAELQKTNPALVERIAHTVPGDVARTKVTAGMLGGVVAGGASPFIDKDPETGFKSAIAFGLIGGMLGRNFAAKNAYSEAFEHSADITETAAQVANFRNLNIAAQSSAAQVYKVAETLVDNDLHVQKTMMDLARDDKGLTVIPVDDQKAYQRFRDLPATSLNNRHAVLFQTENKGGQRVVRSILVGGKDTPEDVWATIFPFFERTGLLPNEMISAGGQIAMTINDAAKLPLPGVRAAIKVRPTFGVVLRDPVSGRVAVVPDYAIRRVSGPMIQMIDDKQLNDLSNHFLSWSQTRLNAGVTETTPLTEYANKHIYPNTPQIINDFISGEGRVMNLQPDDLILPNDATAKSFKNARNREGSVNKFQITDIYHALTNDDFDRISKALVGREMGNAIGYIDYATRNIVVRWQRASWNGVAGSPEMVQGHEIFHPIANAIVNRFPFTAREFFKKALTGEGVHPATTEYAKMLNQVAKEGNDFTDSKGNISGPGKFVLWQDSYPTWESRWEEVITNELGIRAVESGALTEAKTARLPVGELITQYLDEVGGTDDKIPSKIDRQAARTAINNRIAHWMYDILLSDEQKALISKFKDNTLATVKHADAKALVNEASSMGFYLDDAGSGRIHVRDIYSEEIIRTFDNTGQAREFLQQSTQPASRAIDVDPSVEMVPEEARGLGGGVMPPSGRVAAARNSDYSTPYEYHKPGWFEKLNSFFNASTPRFTAMRDYMIALDNLFKTELFEKVYRPTQDAAMKNNEARLGWLKRLSEIEGNILGLDKEQRKLISSYRETMTPDEVINSYMARGMNSTEIKYAGMIRDMNVDLQKVFDYLRRVEQLKMDAGNIGKFDFTGDVKGTVEAVVEHRKLELQKSIDELGKAMGMDNNHMATAGLFNQIKGMNPDQVSLGAVVRLSRSYGKLDTGPELGRAEFASKNHMTPAQVRTATELDKMYSDLAETFEIDDYRRLSAYMNHYRLYNELPEETSQFLRRLQKGARRINEKEFVSQLMRTGELGLFETDPIRAALSYINAGFSNIHLHPTLRAAEAEVARQLGTIANRKGKHATLVLTRYLDELRGHPSMSVEQTQANFDAFLKNIGQDKDLNFRNNLVNMYLAVSNTATMGFRPALALRDLASWYTAYGSRFGVLRATHGLRLAMKPGVTEYLRSKGVLPTIDIVEFLSPAEYESSGLANAGNKLPTYLRTLAKAGMTASGQKNVFEMIHAAAYLEVENLLLGSKQTPGLLVKLQRGELSKAKVYKKAFINSYDIPVIKAFDNLVSAGKMEEAAHFLAKATSEETGFVYNQANHPHGWETNTGRVAGQFGTWPVWMTRYLTRLASRGTRGELFGVYSRFAMLQGAIKGAEIATGFNFYSWYLSPNFGYAGGPMLHTAIMIGEYLSTSSDRIKEQKLRELSNMLPFVRYGKFDPSKVGSIFVPGSFAMQDWMSAFELYSQGYNPITSLGKGFGAAVDSKRRSMLDTVFGSRHPYKY